MGLRLDVGNLHPMTETVFEQAVIDEALRLIDAKLADLLLDVRMLLTAADLASESGPIEEPSPVGA